MQNRKKYIKNNLTIIEKIEQTKKMEQSNTEQKKIRTKKALKITKKKKHRPANKSIFYPLESNFLLPCFFVWEKEKETSLKDSWQRNKRN